MEVEIPARLLRAPRVHEWEFVQDLRSVRTAFLSTALDVRRTYVVLLTQADRHWSPPQLGERVASVHVVGVPVGTRGVIIALHPSTGCVEVIWDEAVVRFATTAIGCSAVSCPVMSAMVLTSRLGAASSRVIAVLAEVRFY